MFNENEKTVMNTNTKGKLIVPVSINQPISTSIDSVNSRNWKALIKSSNKKEIKYELKQQKSLMILKLFTKSTIPIEVEEVMLIKNEVLKLNQ